MDNLNRGKRRHEFDQSGSPSSRQPYPTNYHTHTNNAVFPVVDESQPEV